MKNFFLLFAMIILNCHFLTAVSPVIKLEPKNKVTAISFDLIAKNNTTISIDWGDGNIENFDLGTNYVTFTGSEFASEIKIYGNSIAGFKILQVPLAKAIFADNYGFKEVSIIHCQLDSLYLINNDELETLYVNYNNLKSLNLEGNSSLIHLEFLSNSISVIDLSPLEKLKFLGANNNNIRRIDFSRNKLLATVDLQYNVLEEIQVDNLINLKALLLYENQLKEIDVSNNPLLTDLVCSYNLLSSIDVSHNPLLIGLGLGSNNLVDLDVTNNTNLTYLNLSNNKLTKKIDLSKNTKLQHLRLSDNKIPSINLTALTDLQQLELANNRLWWIDLNSNAKLWYVDLTQNDFRVNYLPVPKVAWQEYYYNPQRKIGLAYRKYNTFDVIDLSSEVNRDGVNSMFTWKNTSGSILIQDLDYSHSGGKFSFLTVQSDSVFCEITNSLFPNMVLETSKFIVALPTLINNDALINLVVSPNPCSDYLNVKSEKPIHKVEVFNFSGLKLWEYNAHNQLEFSLPMVGLNQGLYLIKVDGQCKSVLKM